MLPQIRRTYFEHCATGVICQADQTFLSGIVLHEVRPSKISLYDRTPSLLLQNIIVRAISLYDRQISFNDRTHNPLLMGGPKFGTLTQNSTGLALT